MADKSTDTRAATPGPWEYAPDKRGKMRVFAGDGEIVRALSRHGKRRLSTAEREANACLIAAAHTLQIENERLRTVLEHIDKKAAAVVLNAENGQLREQLKTIGLHARAALAEEQ